MPDAPSEPDKKEKPQQNPDLSPQSQSEGDSRSESLSLEEITDLGRKAATALSDPLWQETFKRTLNEVIASWLQSDVSETRLRESLWHRAQSLFSLEATLTEQVNMAKQANLTEQERAELDLSHYEDIQGFGLEDILAENPEFNPH